MSTANAAALDYLRHLVAQSFWGTIALQFERGEIVHVRREENLKPSELSGNPRRSNGNSQA
jgi:hypothetical protein